MQGLGTALWGRCNADDDDDDDNEDDRDDDADDDRWCKDRVAHQEGDADPSQSHTGGSFLMSHSTLYFILDQH